MTIEEKTFSLAESEIPADEPEARLDEPETSSPATSSSNEALPDERLFRQRYPRRRGGVF